MTVLLNSNPYFETSTVVFQDAFSRTVSDGLGPQWTWVNGAAQWYAVDGSKAVITIGGKSTDYTVIPTMASVSDLDITFLVNTPDMTPDGGANNPTFSAWARYVDGSNSLRVRAWFTAGNVTLNFTERIGGVETNNGSFPSIAGTSINSPVWVRFRAVGSSVLVKGWVDGQPEPSTWHIAYTTSLLTAGGVRFSASVPTAYTGTVPKTFTLDNLTISTPPADWSALGGTFDRSTAQAHEGIASGLLTPDGVTATVQARAELVPVTAGLAYRGSAWVRCATARTISTGINWHDAGGVLLSSSSGTVTVAAATWTLIEVVGTAPDTATQARLTAGSMTGTPPASTTLHVDEAKLERIGVDITSAFNGSYHSPGIDLTVTGLSGYDTLTIERIDVLGGYPDTPVRGVDHVLLSDTAFAVTDYEAPIGRDITYRVTATAPSFTDTFTRTVSAGWGPGPLGLTWAADGAASQFSVTGAVGQHAVNVLDTTFRSRLSGLSVADVDVKVISLVSTAPVGGYVRTAINLRYLDAANTYTLVVHRQPSGAVDLQLIKVVAGVSTGLAAIPSGITHTAGISLWIRAQVVGAQLQAKVWRDDASEPAGWQIAATDSTFTTGTVAVGSLLPPGNTNTLPFNVVYDSFTVTGIGGPAVVTTVSPASSITIPADNPGVVWLKSVGQPALSRRVNMVDFSETSRPGRVLGEYEVLGRPNKVVLTDVLGGREGSFTVATFPMAGLWESDSNTRDLGTLFQFGGTLLLQNAGVDVTGEEDLFLEIKSVSRKRITVVGGELVHLHTVDFVEVDRPATSQQSLTLRDWADVLLQNATWNDVLTNHTTWLDVLQRNL